MQAPPELTAALPAVLRHLANQIEGDTSNYTEYTAGAPKD